MGRGKWGGGGGEGGGEQNVNENELYKIINLVVASSAISPTIFFLKRISFNLLLYVYKFS